MGLYCFRNEDRPHFSGCLNLPCSTATILNRFYLSEHSDLPSQHALPPAGDSASCFIGPLSQGMVLGGCHGLAPDTPLPHLASSVTWSK